MDKLIARQKSKRKRLLYNNTGKGGERISCDLKVTGVMPEKGRKWEQVLLDYRESYTTPVIEEYLEQMQLSGLVLFFFRVCFLRARKVNTYSAVFLIEK